LNFDEPLIGVPASESAKSGSSKKKGVVVVNSRKSRS
jgi:hypothetical protein